MPHRQTDTISLSAKEMVAFLLRQGMSSEALLHALSELAPEKVKTTDSSFPSATLAADLIPGGWKIVEDVAPSEFKIGDLKFLSFLKESESSVTGKTMRQRAVAMKGNLGLSDAKRLLTEKEKIPRDLRGCYIVFPGTVLRVPRGCLGVAYLYWGVGRWGLFWAWLGSGWGGRGRFACSE